MVKGSSLSTYIYLGMLISKNGNIQKLVEDRVKQTKRATFALKQALGTSVKTSPKLAMSLYEKQIEPPPMGLTRKQLLYKNKL